MTTEQEKLEQEISELKERITKLEQIVEKQQKAIIRLAGKTWKF
jgi:archaellum component FlaC